MTEPLDPEQYPGGKIAEDDEGALELAIGIEKGTVKIVFPYAVSWIAMPPENAIGFAEAIIRYAKEVQSVASKNN
jgi:hypothetical protein